MDVAALRVALAPGDKDSAGVDDLRPPAVIGIALVKDVSGAFSSGMARPATTSSILAEVTSNHTGRRCRES